MSVGYRVTLTAHNTRLDSNRLDLSVAINVEVADTGRGGVMRAAALSSAAEVFRAMGLGDVIDSPDMRISWDAVRI